MDVGGGRGGGRTAFVGTMVAGVGNDIFEYERSEDRCAAGEEEMFCARKPMFCWRGSLSVRRNMIILGMSSLGSYSDTMTGCGRRVRCRIAVVVCRNTDIVDRDWRGRIE